MKFLLFALCFVSLNSFTAIAADDGDDNALTTALSEINNQPPIIPLCGIYKYKDGNCHYRVEYIAQRKAIFVEVLRYDKIGCQSDEISVFNRDPNNQNNYINRSITDIRVKDKKTLEHWRRRTTPYQLRWKKPCTYQLGVTAVSE